jgi:high-affinity nickel-transport protein
VGLVAYYLQLAGSGNDNHPGAGAVVTEAGYSVATTTARFSLTRREWARAAGMIATIAGLTVIGWGVLLLLVVPGHYSVGTKTFGVGIGLTAYTLGMRHAFDADHISAIDNTTRKLMSDGQRPLSVGFWFSLGHSSVVFALSLLLGFGVKALVGPVANDGSALHAVTGVVGTSVSGVFLYLIAGINIVVLVGILKVFGKMRRGQFDEAALEHHLNNRGFMNRIFGRFTRSITKPWQMYPVGLLFGLGFDTATEVALLVLAGTGAAANLPWYAILCLPVLFAAGMSLFDSIDGSFMNFAYGWAFSKPVRKVYYNITITGLSVAVALLIGTVEVLGLLVGEFKWTGSFWAWVSNLDLNVMALAVYRFARIEDKWTARLRTADE